VTHRWLGGTLTNWTTIRKRIDTLKSLEQQRDKGEFAYLTKKEQLTMERKIDKLQLRLGGIRNMKRVPDLVFIVDTLREETAVKECNILDIPVLALLDSNGDPDTIDYILPANDDAMRAIKLMVAAVADAVLAGRAMRKGDDMDDMDTMADVDLGAYDANMDNDDEDDDNYLGASTLEKIRSQRLLDEDDEEEDDE
jgi:small subunit ribosomal protein S2